MVDLLSARWAALAALVALAACAHGGREESAGEPPAPRAGEPPAATAEPARPAPREVSTDRANAADPGAGTPQRRSSLGAVEEGKGYLIAGQPAVAARRFETATRIDPTNGFAWYWLGRARIALGDRSGAAGVLEKAEALLGPYPEWRARAAELRAGLGG